MARRRTKVKMVYIPNNSTRKNCYKKRSRSFVKKMQEITTLCGVEACVQIYSDFDDVEPTTWPSEDGMRRIIERFQRMPASERERWGLDQESFIRQMIMKAEEKLKKLRSENRYKEFSVMLYETLEESVPVVPFMVDEDYVELDRVVSQHLREARSLVEKRMRGEGSSSNPPPPQSGDNLFSDIPSLDLNFAPFNMDFSMPVVPSPLPFPTDFSPSNEFMMNSPMPDMGSSPPPLFNPINPGPMPPNEMINSPMIHMGSFQPPLFNAINPPMPSMASFPAPPNEVMNPPMLHMGSSPPLLFNAINPPMPGMGSSPPLLFNAMNPPMPNMGSFPGPSNTNYPPMPPQMGSFPDPSDADNSPMPNMGFFPPPE